MRTINILAIFIGIFVLFFLETAFLVKAATASLIEQNNGLIKDIMSYSFLSGIIYAMFYMIIKITISQTEFSKNRMQKAVHYINKKNKS